MNNIEDIKKEFEIRFTRMVDNFNYSDDRTKVPDFKVYVSCEEVWNFFEPYLTHDEIKRKAVRGFIYDSDRGYIEVEVIAKRADDSSFLVKGSSGRLYPLAKTDIYLSQLKKGEDE